MRSDHKALLKLYIVTGWAHPKFKSVFEDGHTRYPISHEHAKEDLLEEFIRYEERHIG